VKGNRRDLDDDDEIERISPLLTYVAVGAVQLAAR
jgi:hypothetical protein